MEFKNRQGENLNRKRLEIVSQTPTQLVVDVFSAASNVTEYGTPINAETLTELQNEIVEKLEEFESLLRDKGATVKIGGQNVTNVEFLSNPQDQLNAKLNKSELLDLVYPVGAIYLSVNSTSPTTLFGGIWEEYASGRTIIGQGTSDLMYSAGAVGGESKHTITLNELPNHSHPCNTVNSGETTFRTLATETGTGMTSSGLLSASSDEKLENIPNYNGSNYLTLNNINLNISNHTHTIGSIGAGASHNNMPPYIVCYIWKRIA